MRINDKFEMNYDKDQWLLYEYKPGFNIVDGKKIPAIKKTGPRFYSSLPVLCSVVVDRSAGHACAKMECIKTAIQQAKKDLCVAICGGGWR
jgi:hypothetical protein